MHLCIFVFVRDAARSVPPVPFRSGTERNGTGVCGGLQGTERNGTGVGSDLEERNGTERVLGNGGERLLAVDLPGISFKSRGDGTPTPAISMVRKGVPWCYPHDKNACNHCFLRGIVICKLNC